MLEDGELSDDDFQEIQPSSPQVVITEIKSKNKLSLLPTPKIALLGSEPPSIPSLLSPNFDSLVEKINSSLNQNNNNKRKGNKNGDKLNKKKLKDKHHHHHHRHHKHRRDEDENEDEGDEECEEINEEDQNQAQDQDDRLFDASASYFKPIYAKAPLLATPLWTPTGTTTPNGANQVKQTPVSLLDLFKNPSNTYHHQNNNNNSLLGHPFSENQNSSHQQHFVNPIIVEKENSKPKLVNDHDSDEDAGGDSEMVSVDSIKEKLDKKRKYAEIHKIIKHKEQEKQQVQKEKSAQLKEKVLCHFFVEGRCQKGDKCTFSHNLQLNPKKYEICKFYLNGFCSKGDKCFFMHSEFPCKFYHRVNYRTGQKKSECTNGEACRFSHEPITNVLLKEAFEKYLAETGDGSSEIQMPKLQIQIPTALNQRQSILGSPPPILLNGSNNKGDLNQVIIKNESSNMSSLPSLMDMSVKPAILATPVTPLLRNDNRTFSPPSSPPAEKKYKDVDERMPLLLTRSPPLLNQQPKIIKRDLDIDERYSYTPLPPLPHIHINTNIPPPTLTLSAQDNNKNSNYQVIKKELTIKVMKAIADEDESIFSQIPKQTLTEILVKLLNSNNENKLSIHTIETLLTTLTTPPTQPKLTIEDTDTDNLQIAEDESPNLKITTTTKRKYNGGSDYGDYDDEYDQDETKKISITTNNTTVIDEEDDYDYDNDLVIEGNIGEIPYRLYEIDIEPSELWSKPPVGPYDSTSLHGFNPATLLSQISSTSSNDQSLSDQECDPRIKYYSEKSNWLNVANFQQLLIQQQQQQTPGSPVAVETVVPEPVKAIAKPLRADPRLASRNVNLSPTRSITPPAINEAATLTNDLISIQNRQVTVSSLLSSLPDFHFPKDNKILNNSTIPSNLQINQVMMMSQESSTVTKLSIADYKRKLQKPTTTTTTTTASMMSSLLTSANTNNSQSSQNSNSTSSLPSIPSYSVNLQAPQSLHELFRNFQS